MNLKTLISSLSDEEKSEAFSILGKEILKKPKIETFTTIDEFCRKNKNIISKRLTNVLLNNKDWIGHYIETFQERDIYKCRNAGYDTVSEFIELRGY